MGLEFSRPWFYSLPEKAFFEFLGIVMFLKD